MKRFCFDASRISHRRSGIENFALAAITGAVRVVRAYGDWRLRILCTPEGRDVISERIDPSAQDVSLAQVPATKPWLGEQIHVPLAVARTGGCDLFYSPGYPASPLISTKALVQQVHDMGPWRFPSTMTAGARLYWRLLLPPAVRGSVAVLTNSTFTKQELIAVLKVDPHKVQTVYGAIDDRFVQFEDYAGTRQFVARMGLRQPYFLAVGNNEPRKNLVFLLEVFERFVLCYPKDDVRLVFAGGRGWRNEAFYDKMGNSSVRDRIIHLGWVDDVDLPYLICGAAALLFPSVYEGFGIPPLEALALGTPSVVSRTASLPEVLQNQALFADPDSPREWVAQMRRVLEQDTGWMPNRKSARALLNRYSVSSLADRLSRAFERAMLQPEAGLSKSSGAR